MRILPAVVVTAILPMLAGSTPAAMKDTPHPYILWTPAEAAAIRKRIETQPWARESLEQMATDTRWDKGKPLVNLFRYAVLGDEQAGEVERDYLLSFIGAKLNRQSADGHQLGKHYDNYIHALRYDVLYDSLTPKQRKDIEDTFRQFIQYELDHPYVNTRISLLPNMQLPRLCAAQLMSVAMKDEKLIRRLWEAPSAFRWFMGDYLADGCFYNEEFAKMQSTIGEMLLYCRGLERLGLNELGYGFVGQGGGSMRRYVESYIRLGYPRTILSGGMPRYERIAMGDARGTTLGVFQHANVTGALRQLPAAEDSSGKRGESRMGQQFFFAANMNGRDHRNTKTVKLGMPMWFEILKARYQDAPFAYFLAQMRGIKQDRYYPTLFWGLDPIDPKRVKPPPATSYVAPQRGFAMLRAEESPAYWESPAPAVCLQFATLYVHYTSDCFSLLGYHAFNRPIYFNRPISAGYNGGPWDFSLRGHCGVVVDGLQAQPIGEVPTRQQFTPLVKFVSARGEMKNPNEPYKGQGEVRSSDQPQMAATEIYPNVELSRSLMLTSEYLFDVYAVADKAGQPRQYHWLVHAPGVLMNRNGWRSSTELQNTLMNVSPTDLPKNDGQDFARQYRIPAGPNVPAAERSWIRISNEKKIDPGSRPLSITVQQSCILPDVAQSVLGKAWYDRKIGVRMRMLGEEGTTAFAMDTPTHYPPGTPRCPRSGQQPQRPETGGVSLAVARKSPATLFVALHEPFADGAPKIEQFRRIQQTPDAVAVAIVAPGLNDRAMLHLAETEEPTTLAGDGERFTFANFAFVRIHTEKVEVSGDLSAMTLKVSGRPKLMINGQQQRATVSDGLMSYEE